MFISRPPSCNGKLRCEHIPILVIVPRIPLMLLAAHVSRRKKFRQNYMTADISDIDLLIILVSNVW